MSEKRRDVLLKDYFEGCLYYSAGRLYRSVERLAFRAFKPIDLAPSHAFFIMALSEVDGGWASPSDLSKIMNLDRSTVTRLMSSLKKKDLVKSTPQGRFQRMTLTKKGIELLPEIKAAWSKLYQLYTEELGRKSAHSMNACIRSNLTLPKK